MTACYTLMHKNVETLSFSLDRSCRIERIGGVFAPRHLPVGVAPEAASLQAWWSARSLPPGRDGVWKDLRAVGIERPAELLPRCRALGLSDTYWIRPAGSREKWEDVNFYGRPFTEAFGRLLLGEAALPEGFDTPDCTLDGFLRKRWTVRGGARYLLKTGSAPYFQEPLNEAAAARILGLLGVPHVPYTLERQGGAAVSVCPCFTDGNTDYIPMAFAVKTAPRDPAVPLFEHVVRSCGALGVPAAETRRALDRMLLADYILGNEDRHLNNFGLLRDAETLEITGFAPLFDHGSSLGYASPEEEILKRPPSCKPFAGTWEEQLRLVSDLARMETAALSAAGAFDAPPFPEADGVARRRLALGLRAAAYRAEKLTETRAGRG